ncbi:helix-turn-helix domain-containing protein [Leptospira adleri]|uniref:helix-turn-helix domain-containing protein n=1 Tax=Leptospira adleri TaxID=2023186 RepID=UPI0013FDE7E5
MSTDKFKDSKYRIQEILDSSGLAKNEFADRLGITKGQVSHLLSGARKPSLTLSKLIKFEFGYLEEWTFKGEGPMKYSPPGKEEMFRKMEEEENFQRKIRNTEGAREFVMEYFELTPESRSIFLNLMRNRMKN